MSQLIKGQSTISESPEWIQQIQERLLDAKDAGMEKLKAIKSSSNRYMDAIHDINENSVCLVGAHSWELQNLRSEFLAKAYPDTSALLEHCLKLRDSLENVQKQIDTCRPGLPSHIEEQLYGVMASIDEALLHKPEGEI